MRINLTKKDIINAIYMQIGYSKKICEALIDDFFDILLENLIKYQKIKISGFGTFFLKKKKERRKKQAKKHRRGGMIFFSFVFWWEEDLFFSVLISK